MKNHLAGSWASAGAGPGTEGKSRESARADFSTRVAAPTATDCGPSSLVRIFAAATELTSVLQEPMEVEPIFDGETIARLPLEGVEKIAAPELVYGFDVEVTMEADRDLAEVELRVTQDQVLLKEVRWRPGPARRRWM